MRKWIKPVFFITTFLLYGTMFWAITGSPFGLLLGFGIAAMQHITNYHLNKVKVGKLK